MVNTRRAFARANTSAASADVMNMAFSHRTGTPWSMHRRVSVAWESGVVAIYTQSARCSLSICS